MRKSCYSKWQNHGKLGWILQMVSLPTVWLSKKSPLVRSEMVCAASGAQCKERPDAGAMGSQDEVECKRQGDLKVMAWWGLVDGRMLEVRWMVDENGRPQSVTLQRYQDMYSRQYKIDQALGVTGLCKMEQRPAQPTSASTFSMTNFKQECSPFWSPLGHTNGRPKVQIWTIFSLVCLGLRVGPILLHQT